MYKLIKGLAERKAGKPQEASVLRLVQAIFWSFFGVRRMQDLDSDAYTLTPLQVIVAGLIGAVILVCSLLLLVRHILS